MKRTNFHRILLCLLLLASPIAVLHSQVNFDAFSVSGTCFVASSSTDLIFNPTSSSDFQVSLDGGATFEAINQSTFNVSLANSPLLVVIKDEFGTISPVESLDLSLPIVPTGVVEQFGCTAAGLGTGFAFVNDPGDSYEIVWFADPNANLPADGNASGVLNGSIIAPNGPGLFYAEMINKITGCKSSSRLEVNYDLYPEVSIDIIGFECDPTPGYFHYFVTGNGGSGENYTVNSSYNTQDYPNFTHIEDVTLGVSADIVIQDDNGCSSELLNLPPLLCFCGVDEMTDATATKTQWSYCYGETIPLLSINPPVSTERAVRWYANSSGYEPANGVASGPANEHFQANAPGTYYASYYHISNGCVSNNRLAIELIEMDELLVESELQDCSTDLQTYSVFVEIAGGSPSYDLITAGFTVNETLGGYLIEGLPAGEEQVLMVQDSEFCTVESITLPMAECSCDLIDFPVTQALTSSQIICYNDPVPMIGTTLPGIDFQILWFEDEDLNIPAAGIVEGVQLQEFYPEVAKSYFPAIQHVASSCLMSTGLQIDLIELPPLEVNPIASDCALDFASYDFSFELSGGTNNGLTAISSLYAVNQTGTEFTVNAIAAGTSLELTLMDDGGCAEQQVLAPVFCDCADDPLSAPVSQVTAVLACADELGVLSVEDPGPGFIVRWYHDADGVLEVNGSLNGPQANELEIGEAGVYYAFLENELSACRSQVGTAIELSYAPTLELANVHYTCSEDLMSFDLSFEIVGGMSTNYSVLSDELTVNKLGDIFTITGIPEGDPVLLSINDDAGCVKSNVSAGTYICQCNPADIPFVIGERNYYVCDNDELPTILIDDPGDGFLISWYAQEEGGELLDASANFSVPAVGNYFVEFTHELSGCSSFSRSKFTVKELPSIEVEIGDFNCFDNGLAYQQGLKISGGLSDNYSIDAGGLEIKEYESGEFSLLSVPINEAIELTVSSNSICTTDPIILEAKQCPIPDRESKFIVADAISPNGDGVNDNLRYLGGNPISSLIIVYNRWGEEVHRSADTAILWDGKRDELQLPVGVYPYLLHYQFEGKELERTSGAVLLLH